MPLLEGFVCKQGSGRGLFEFKTWKVRWCVVENGSIKFYSEYELLRDYSLVGSSLTARADAAAHGAPFESVFIIHFSAESQAAGSPPEVVLCVEFREDMQKWIDVIKAAAASTQAAKISVDEPSSWLSLEEIKSLAAMLSCDNFSPVFAFAGTITPSQSVAFVERTLAFLLHSSDMPRFVETCVERAMLGQVLSTLFRENNVYLRFIVGYLFLIGREYLKKVIEPHVIKIIQHHSLEVNPLKFPKVDSAAAPQSDAEHSTIEMIQLAHCKANHSKIIAITQALLTAIDTAELPDLIVKVLHHIATLVNRHFPEFLYSGVVNIFFLRFIVASFCSPHAFGLCTDISLNALQTRNLSIVAKVVQNIANGIVENKKEPYMQPLAAFVQEQQIFMIKFLTKVLQAGSSLSAAHAASAEQTAASLSASLSNLPKAGMQDLQQSSNYWIQLIHRSSSELPPEMQAVISKSDFDNSPMRDSIRGQLLNWSSITEGRLVYSRPVLMSSLKPSVFVGDAFIIAYFNCWCKLNRAMMHGTMYVTRCAFIFIATVFDSFDEVLVMRCSKIERITKLNVGDVDSLCQLDLNRPFFVGLQSAICVDFVTESGSPASAILFGITVDSDNSNVELPVDGLVDSSGKKSPSIFAAMYSLLSLSKNRQAAESSDAPAPVGISRTNSVKFSVDAVRPPADPTSLSPAMQKRSMSGKFVVKRNSLSLPQLALLQDIASAGPEDAASNAASSGSRARRDSIRSHAGSLLRHITALRNCYEVNFSGTRFITRDPPILTRADWDAILPFICVMVFNPGQYAEVPDASKRYLLSVNSGSFAYCSGSKKTIDFFLSRGNSMVYDSDAASRNFSQLPTVFLNCIFNRADVRCSFACEPRSSLVILQIPLESIPSAPEGLESRFIDFALAAASSCFTDVKRVERSLALALQSATKLEASSDSTEALDSTKSLPHISSDGAAAPDLLAKRDTSFTSSTKSSTQDKERFMQAVRHTNQSRKSVLLPENFSIALDETN